MNTTKQKIIKNAKHIFSTYGYEGLTMRTLSEKSDISLSVIYHHFPNKDSMLDEIFEITRKELGKKRNELMKDNKLETKFEDIVKFQFDNSLDVIFILKYYLHFRNKYERNNNGYVPKQAYKHIYEILEELEENKKLKNINIEEEAKIITHMINGFILEYFPQIPDENEKEKIAKNLSNFISRSIKKEVNVNAKR